MNYANDMMRAAKFFVMRFGKDAPFEAVVRADELEALGDPEGREMWRTIAKSAASILENGESEDHAQDLETRH